MSIGLLFWVLYIVAIVFSGWSLRAGSPQGWGSSLLFFALTGLLGWHVFGAPVHV